MPSRRLVAAITGIAAMSALAGCSKKQPPTETYFDRTIRPILQDSCVSTNTGANCHVADAKGNALGNLSLETYDDVNRRRDLLVPYGPYGQPGLLLKNVRPYQLQLTTYDGKTVPITTDIRHTGGATLDVTSSAFATLKTWIANGATENNAMAVPEEAPRDPCVETVPSDPDFDPSTDPATSDFAEFRTNVQPIVGSTCAAGNCHGSLTNSLYLVCATSKSGDAAKDAELVRWNYFATSRYIASAPNPQDPTTPDVSESELLRRPLDPSRGGAFHEGGILFDSEDDPDWQALESWAVSWAKANAGKPNYPTTKGFAFFGSRVQPMLVKKGCMMLGCHSPAMFHDYRLRGGGGGSLSVAATVYNYALSLVQLAVESPDPNASRLVAKNLPRPEVLAGGRGLAHRGGPLFADVHGGRPTLDDCDLDAAENGPLDEQPAYCVVAKWLQIERAERNLVPFTGVIYVKRPPATGPDGPQDFATYSPGADLCFTGVTMDDKGALASQGGACTSLLAGCGLSASTADVRHPAVSWSGAEVAFAARSGQDDPWAIYTMKPDGSACAKQPDIAAPPVDEHGNPLPTNGALVHDFDPTFSPDGRLVFASTRGNVMNTSAFDYQGPQRTPADPSRWNANLYVLDAPGKIRQLTFLLNQEILPSFMADGRLIFTAEKRTPGFYELAGRRQNIDGGDYHPLFAQRRTVGYAQFTEVVELANKDFAAIYSDQGAAHMAGTLGLLNRSLGPDLVSTDPADYVADPDAMSWQDPKFYLHSLTFPDPAATGHVGQPTTGAYRSPAPLPNGDVLVSYAANVTDLSSFSGNFDLWALDPITGQKTLQLTNDPNTDEIWGVAVYQRAVRGLFPSRVDEPNGSTKVFVNDPDHPADRADITVLDTPVLASLFFQNTRSRRPLPALDKGLDVYESLPPPLDQASFDAATPAFVVGDAYGKVYARRRWLGSVSLYDDGSSHLQVPGGLPILFAGDFTLEGDSGPTRHHQREEMMFYPGEWVHQSFPRGLFDGICAGCHGSVSGRENDIAVRPDFLTQASRVLGRDKAPDDFVLPPSSRGPEVGPPF